MTLRVDPQTAMENAAYRLDDVVRAAAGVNTTPADVTGTDVTGTDVTGTDVTLTLPAEAWRPLSIIALLAARCGLSNEGGRAVSVRALQDAPTLQPNQQ